MDGLYLFIVKEMPRTEGNRSECWRMNQIDFKFGTGLGFANAVAAEKASEHVAEPLVHMVGQVEKLLNQYKPPVIERDQERVDLTWKGGLWRMALEAALGVQYLHHHRYARREENGEPHTLHALTPTFFAGTGAMGGSGTTGRSTRLRRRRPGGRSR
jgi:hypothetical protein